ncbi:MAG: hypothetical protein A2075_00115 [Geobacteraceae bacterium GWC2_58_44]|nr:MAG: hypothetical protein A2075_00115 [Geobacteraceae bacterium GWC2_58_44]HBG06843.1 hypothetical protein [Geobacter sp.]
MTESINNRYQRLFQIRLLHHYWLDEGGTCFDLIASQATREERLLSYDMRSFLAVAPTAVTAQLLDGLGCVYKNSALGCMVAAPQARVIPDDAIFEFLVTVQNAAFFNYTALTLRLQKIYEIFHQPEKKIYRYKEHVPLFSNLTGASRGTGPGKALFLSTEFPALSADDKVEALFVSGNSLVQLTGDQPGAGTHQIAPQATNLPVYVNQADVQAIVPPAGLVGAPARGIQLTDEIPDHVFALIRLCAIRPDDTEFSLIDADGHAKSPGPVFDIRFKGRSTTWQYLNKSTGALISAESNPLPLTHYGNAGSKQKPSEGVVKAVQSGDKITQLVSEIFI